MKIETLLEAYYFDAVSELYKNIFDLDVPVEKLKEIVTMLWDEGLEIYSNEKQAGTASLTADECMYLNMTFDNGELEMVELFIKLLPIEMTKDGIIEYDDDESDIPNQTN